MNMNTIFLIIFTFSFSSCDQQSDSIISLTELKSLRSQGVSVIDIRTEKEFNLGRIPGAMNIDYHQTNFYDKCKNLGISKPIVIYCASGGRSKSAQDKLLKLGFLKVYDYSGGFRDWLNKDQEIER